MSPPVCWLLCAPLCRSQRLSSSPCSGNEASVHHDNHCFFFQHVCYQGNYLVVITTKFFCNELSIQLLSGMLGIHNQEKWQIVSKSEYT